MGHFQKSDSPKLLYNDEIFIKFGFLRGGHSQRYHQKSLTTIFTGSNWPNSQIPQCTFTISHNAPFRNRNTHISALNNVLWDMGEVHCGICEFRNITGRKNHENLSTPSGLTRWERSSSVTSCQGDETLHQQPKVDCRDCFFSKHFVIVLWSTKCVNWLKTGEEITLTVCGQGCTLNIYQCEMDASQQHFARILAYTVLLPFCLHFIPVANNLLVVPSVWYILSHIPLFHANGYQQPMPYQCWKMTENANTFYGSWNKFSTSTHRV